MDAVIGLLMMLLGVSHGVETYCDGRHDGAQCYGALGGTLVLHLMDNASEIFRYQWGNKTVIILHGRKNLIVSNVIRNRSSFTPSNGTFRINELSRTDGGEYTLNIFGADGKKGKSQTLQITIQAPVSSVLLDSECLSQGEMKVSCTSEGGDGVQYNWTLGGRALTDAELLSGNTETTSVTLKQHVSGLLVCSARNHVSNVWKEKQISTCGFMYINCTSSNGTHISQWVFAANNTLCIKPTTAPTTVTETSPAGKETGITVSINPCTNITSCNQNVTSPPPRDEPWYSNLKIMVSVLCALILLLVVGVAVVCAQKKKQKDKPKEDDQELTYAEVKIKHRPGRQMQQAVEPEVEYGQVKFSEGPRRTVQPTEDECVYSKVRKSR